MFILLLVLAGWLQVATPPAEPPKVGKSEIQTPEQVLKSFLIAMLAGDKETLQNVTLETKELDVLIGKQPVPEKDLTFIKAFIEKEKMRVLKPGEEVELPGGKKVVVTDDEAQGSCAILSKVSGPLPIRLKQVEGQWRVDASPIIASRKAAAALRDKNK